MKYSFIPVGMSFDTLCSCFLIMFKLINYSQNKRKKLKLQSENLFYYKVKGKLERELRSITPDIKTFTYVVCVLAC